VNTNILFIIYSLSIYDNFHILKHLSYYVCGFETVAYISEPTPIQMI